MVVSPAAIRHQYAHLNPPHDDEIIDHSDGQGPQLFGWPKDLPLPPEDPVLPEPLDKGLAEARLTTALNLHLDTVAGQRRYDNRFTCALRASYAGVFREEGLAFATWMDHCNIKAYRLMAEFKRGARATLTEAQLIAAMPSMLWPPSPIPLDTAGAA